MRCETFENRLQQLLDERNRPEEDALLAEHAAECTTCRDVLDAQAGLFDTVRDWSVSNLEVDLVDRVLARVPAEAAKAPEGARRWWQGAWTRWIGLGVAAAVLGVIVWQSVERWRASPSDPHPSSFVSIPAPPETEAPRPAEGGPWLTEARMNGVARDLGYGVAQSVYYIQGDRLALATNVTLPEPVAAGLRPLLPVKHTVVTAVDALRNALPRKVSTPLPSTSSSYDAAADVATIV